jgi:hypothetical protein
LKLVSFLDSKQKERADKSSAYTHPLMNILLVFKTVFILTDADFYLPDQNIEKEIDCNLDIGLECFWWRL